MAYAKLTADEAAALIKNGDTIGLSGFTAPGTPKFIPIRIHLTCVSASTLMMPIISTVTSVRWLRRPVMDFMDISTMP